MQIGLVGLGRMGSGIAGRLLQARHAIVGFDVSRAQVEQMVQTGAAGARSIQDLVGQLAPPRAVWVMVPHGGPTRTTIEELLPLLAPEDIVIDGGNSRYTDSVAHAARCREHGVHFLDVGVSGGVWGLAEGFNLMIGGPDEAFSLGQVPDQRRSWQQQTLRRKRRTVQRGSARLRCITEC